MSYFPNKWGGGAKPRPLLPPGSDAYGVICQCLDVPVHQLRLRYQKINILHGLLYGTRRTHWQSATVKTMVISFLPAQNVRSTVKFKFNYLPFTDYSK